MWETYLCVVSTDVIQNSLLKFFYDQCVFASTGKPLFILSFFLIFFFEKMRTRIALFGLGRIGQIHLENIIINPQ